ncbi:LysR substrate-binding domain-containing protein, partial [Variovorax sp. CT11-76]
VVAATPGRTARPAPRALADLAAHECIQFTLPSTGQPVPWLLHGEGGVFEHATQGGIRYSEDILGGVTLARAGAGLLQTYRFIVEEDLARGALVELLPDFAGASRPFSLIHPAHRHMPRRVRVFIDFLLERLSSPPGPRARY